MYTASNSTNEQNMKSITRKKALTFTNVASITKREKVIRYDAFKPTNRRPDHRMPSWIMRSTLGLPMTCLFVV